MEKWGPCTLLVRIQNVSEAIGKSLTVLHNLNIELPYDPEVPLLDVQLTLEQHGFELCKSTYMWNF